MKSTAKTKVWYWIFTLLFVLPMIGMGILLEASLPPIVATMTHLGYPIYFIRFLGTAKLSGAAAILFDRLPHIKEWAYAGFAFNMIGATYSHLYSDESQKVVGPLTLLVFEALSYYYWRRIRCESSARRIGMRVGHENKRVERGVSLG